MSKILQEVRDMSSQKIAEKQKSAEIKYPELIEKIKAQAGFGKTSCEFPESAIDQYSKRLLEADGFNVYATTRKKNYANKYWPQSLNEAETVWIINW